MKNLIYIGIIMISIIMLSSCKRDKLELETVLCNYYMKNWPKNTGELEVLYESYDERDGFTYVLVDKYVGEGEQSLELFILNNKMQIQGMGRGTRAISPCYTVNYSLINDKQVIFGDFKDTKYDYELEKVVGVQPHEINVAFKDNEIITVAFDREQRDVYLIITNNQEAIVKADVLDGQGNIISSLKETILAEVQITP